MRVLLVANTLPPDDISGVGEQVLQLAAGLEASGHEVRVLGRRRRGLASKKLLFPLTVVPGLGRELASFRPDVVQVHESDGGLALLFVSVARGLEDRPIRLSVLLQVSYCQEFSSVRPIRYRGKVLGRPGADEWWFKIFKAPLQVTLGALSAYLADIVLSPSRQTASEIERDYGVEQVAVLPNIMGGRQVALEEDPSIGDARGFLLYVGRLRIRKAVEVLLESLASLGEQSPHLLIVGDGEHAERLRRRAEALELGQLVRFLGRRTPGQVRYLMERAGGLVVPSIYEGMPLVVLEAMQAGLPVIASRVSGMPEVVGDPETGWLVPAEDPAALAAALEQWHSDPGDARRRGEAGRRRLGERYAAAAVARAWVKLVLPEVPDVETEGASGSQSASAD